MAVIVLIPCLIIAIGFIWFCHNYRRDTKNLKSGDLKSSTKINERIDEMKSRLTVTQNNLFKGNYAGRSSSSYHHANGNSDEMDVDDEMEKNIKTQNALSSSREEIELMQPEMGKERSTQL